MMFRLMLLAVSVIPLCVAQGPLRFEVKHVEKKTPACVITFDYPEIILAASPEVRDRMNAGILRILLRRTDWPPRDSGLRSLDSYANEFLKYCAEFQRGPQPRALYEHKLVTILRYRPPILSFRCDADMDGGGVHPYGTTLYVNFESSSGKTLKLADLLKEGAMEKLNSVAEANFRQDRRLSATDSLSEHAYTFPGDRFRLNENFGVGEREIVFLFNTYEIGPGAIGPTEITIVYPQIRELLKPGLRLW
jgi:uncharacterized protein DUF3298